MPQGQSNNSNNLQAGIHQAVTHPKERRREVKSRGKD
jgi:hypothetical protein